MANTCSCVLILCENFDLSEDDKKAFEESLTIACENNDGFSESSIIQINHDYPIFQGMNSLKTQSQPLYLSNNDNSQPNVYQPSTLLELDNLYFQQSYSNFDNSQYNTSHQQFFPNTFVEPQFNVQPLNNNSFIRFQNYNTNSYLNTSNNRQFNQFINQTSDNFNKKKKSKKE
jgi:hypothetical protein